MHPSPGESSPKIHGTMESMDGGRHAEAVDGRALTRRTFVAGGLAFLAACASSTDTEAGGAADPVPTENRIVLGATDEPSDSSTAGSDTTGTEPAPTPTPDPEREPITPVTFEYLDGGEGSLADFVGTPLVINFFASWCPPCREELPDFESVAQQYAGDVQFLGFSVTDGPETTRELLDETGVTFPVAMDPAQDIHFDLGGIAMPTTILVDRWGNLAAGRFGAISKTDLEELIKTEVL